MKRKVHTESEMVKAVQGKLTITGKGTQLLNQNRYGEIRALFVDRPR